MLDQLRKLVGPWVTRAPRPMPSGYTDGNTVRHTELERELADTMLSLARRQATWDSLRGRDDPDAHLQKDALAPDILDDQAGVQRLSTEISEVTRRITANQETFTRYTQLAAEARTEMEAVLPLADEKVVERFYALSRELDRLAGALLRGTNDRVFRRAAADPFGELRSAVTELDAALDRVRSLRGAIALAQKTKAS